MQPFPRHTLAYSSPDGPRSADQARRTPPADAPSARRTPYIPVVVRWAKLTKVMGRSPVLVFATAALMIAVVAVADYETSSALQLGLFYLAPVTLLSWFAGRRVGHMSAVACTLIAFACEWLRPGPSPNLLVDFWNASIRLFMFSLVVSEQSAIREAFHSEHLLARVDPLTGAANLRMFREEIEHELERCRRYPHPFTVAFIDLDDFKSINDRLGHKAGDAVLQWVAERMTGNLRATDTCARLGGDEFALLMPETGHASAVIALAKIRQNLKASGLAGLPRVTASIGAVTFDSAPNSVDEVIARADYLMYEVKRREGKNAMAVERARRPVPVDLDALDGIERPSDADGWPLVAAPGSIVRPAHDEGANAADEEIQFKWRRNGAPVVVRRRPSWLPESVEDESGTESSVVTHRIKLSEPS